MSLEHSVHTSHNDNTTNPSQTNLSTTSGPQRTETHEREYHWTHKRSVKECDRILTAPGRMHETEQVIIDGRVTKVYKHLPPNIRAFWLDRSAAWRDRDYIVFENERYTYGQVAERASKLASLLYTKYAVRKGDRVAIIMRNYPEFMIAFWAIHLLGGVAVMINAWAPHAPLLHSIVIANPKVIIVDPERADRLYAGGLLDEAKMKTSALYKVFVVRSHRIGGGGAKERAKWKSAGITPLESALENYTGPMDAWRSPSPSTSPSKDSSSSSLARPLPPGPHPDENATIFFTSGTTGLPKGVLSSQRSFLTNVLNGFVAKLRATLRKGEELVMEEDVGAPQKGTLISVPLFHVTGLTSAAMSTTALGGKLAFMHKWDKEEAALIIKRERLTSAGGVPSMIMDLIESSLEGGPGISSTSLEGLSCGGAPSAETMPREVARRFGIEAGQGYGLSETNAIAVSIQGEDFLARPTSTGLATPVNDLIIVDPASQKILPPGQVGELWIKGANVMRGYWGDKDATEKAITPDGWFKSGDSAYIDEEGFVFIKDRIKDIIIRGGENIHSTEVENALYANEHILDAAAVSVPDPRLGELVAAVVATKPHSKGLVTEEEVVEGVRSLLPPHAVPVLVLIQDELIERNANGKIVKDALRKRVRKEWARRLKLRSKSTNRNKSGVNLSLRAKL